MTSRRAAVLKPISQLLTVENLTATREVVRLKVVVLAKMLGGDRVPVEVLIIKELVIKSYVAAARRFWLRLMHWGGVFKNSLAAILLALNWSWD